MLFLSRMLIRLERAEGDNEKTKEEHNAVSRATGGVPA